MYDSDSSSDAGDDVAHPSDRYAPPVDTRRPSIMFDRLYAPGAGYEPSSASASSPHSQPTAANTQRFPFGPKPKLRGSEHATYTSLTPAHRIGMANDSAVTPSRQRVKAPLTAASYEAMRQRSMAADPFGHSPSSRHADATAADFSAVSGGGSPFRAFAEYEDENDTHRPSGLSLRSDDISEVSKGGGTKARMTMPFWNKLKAAEAERSARIDNALETMSNETRVSTSFDANIRYLHGRTIAMADRVRGHSRTARDSAPAAPWTGGTRGGDYERFVGTKGTRHNLYNTTLYDQRWREERGGGTEGAQHGNRDKGAKETPEDYVVRPSPAAAIYASHGNKYETAVKAQWASEEARRLQKKVDRDRMGLALRQAAGLVRREAILAKKPHLIQREAELLGRGIGTKRPYSRDGGHRDSNSAEGPFSREHPLAYAHDYAPPEGEGKKGSASSRFRSDHIVREYAREEERVRCLRNGTNGSSCEPHHASTQHAHSGQNHPRLARTDGEIGSSGTNTTLSPPPPPPPADMADMLDAEEEHVQALRHQHQRAFLDGIAADANALTTDTFLRKEVNHIDPASGRRHPRIYSVENEVDSDSSSDGEYFSLDHKPPAVLAALDTAKPRYAVPDAPVFSVDKRILAEMREEVRRQKEKESAPRQVFATACGPLPPKKADVDSAVNASKTISKATAPPKPQRPHTAPLRRAASSSGVSKAPTPTSNAAAAAPNRTPQGINNQHLNLFHSTNTFREALPQRLLVADSAAAASVALSTGNVAKATRPQSVAGHMAFIKRAESFNSEAVLHGGERRGVITTAASAASSTPRGDGDEPTTTTFALGSAAKTCARTQNAAAFGPTHTSRPSSVRPRKDSDSEAAAAASSASASLNHHLLNALLEKRRSAAGSVMSTAGGLLSVAAGTSPTPVLHVSCDLEGIEEGNEVEPLRHVASIDRGHTTTTCRSAAPSSVGYTAQTCETPTQPLIKASGGVASAAGSFIVPTRPSASSRPPTATRRPQSAGVRRGPF